MKPTLSNDSKPPKSRASLGKKAVILYLFLVVAATLGGFLLARFE